MSQEEDTRAAVLNEAQAACNNRTDELERLVARLQIRSKVQAIRKAPSGRPDTPVRAPTGDDRCPNRASQDPQRPLDPTTRFNRICADRTQSRE
ncbi:hypothetical protein Bca52824_000597 [Brassica carinata]|uniref:Uncharacterized protein n=1 Tax=Brassica carinata TaxID=52824 RepID=A0A8X7WHH9_BRACI|nr:hypothetical protein Bca52824_000597 [Brassica carinata]